jgi:hypothetical protein
MRSLPLFIVALTLALVPCGDGAARADEIGDVMPFGIVHGRPPVEASGAAALLWSEGGRLKLRFQGMPPAAVVEGELRMSSGGVFKDIRPLTENLRVRMPTPDRVRFDVRVNGAVEGFDVALSGDFSTLTVDLRIDGQRRPTELAVGERAKRPAGLPLRLDLDEGAAAWVERFGFH